MTIRPLISVCMPVYNTERYLPAAIQGVLAQTYDHFELIICDNCSTDSSAQVAQDYAERDSRVRFVPNQWNIGYAGNLQKATSLAHGDLVIVHCADDTMLPPALETYIQTIEQLGLDLQNVVVMADTYMIDAEGRPFAILGKAPGRFEYRRRPVGAAPRGERIQCYTGHELNRVRLADLQLFGWLGSILFSRSFLVRTEGYQGGKWISPDQEFMYKVFALNSPVVYIQEPLFQWRLHEANQLGTERRESVIKHSLDLYEHTFQYPESFLAQFGVSRRQLQEIFVSRDCLQKTLYELAVGSWVLGLRYTAFALATYPGIAVRNPKFYLALAGLLTGPIGRLVARAGLSVRRYYQKLELEKEDRDE